MTGRSSAADGPPGSFWSGVSGYFMLCAGLPICLGLAMVPWSPWGLDAFYTGLFVAIGFGSAMIVPLAAGLRGQRPWWRRWVRGAGTALLAGWGVTLLVLLACPLGLVARYPGSKPSLIAADWVGIGFLLALAIPGALLLRTLRDPYWRRPDAAAR